MSKTTFALEACVRSVIELNINGDRQTLRNRINIDHAFATILKLIAPRIRHFIRQYGLVAHWEDAEQCCAIAVHRAIQSYDPAKAQFTTFINWQIRGELQGLRFRMMADQRPSARKVAATTVSLHAVSKGEDGEDRSMEMTIEDEHALSRTEAEASNYLANAAMASLVDAFIDQQRFNGLEQLRKRPLPKRHAAPTLPKVDLNSQICRKSKTHALDTAEVDKLEQKLVRDRRIVERRVFNAVTLDELELETGITKERIRQITKRATQSIAELTDKNPRFAMMADYKSRAKSTLTGDAPTLRVHAKSRIMPDAAHPYNALSRVVMIPAKRDQSGSSEPWQAVTGQLLAIRESA